jgi:hypothetical protein
MGLDWDGDWTVIITRAWMEWLDHRDVFMGKESRNSMIQRRGIIERFNFIYEASTTEPLPCYKRLSISISISTTLRWLAQVPFTDLFSFLFLFLFPFAPFLTTNKLCPPPSIHPNHRVEVQTSHNQGHGLVRDLLIIFSLSARDATPVQHMRCWAVRSRSRARVQVLCAPIATDAVSVVRLHVQIFCVYYLFGDWRGRLVVQMQLVVGLGG